MHKPCFRCCNVVMSLDQRRLERTNLPSWSSHPKPTFHHHHHPLPYFFFFSLLLATSRECSSPGQGEVTTMECRARPLQKALLTLKGQKMKSNTPTLPCVPRTMLHFWAFDREMWSKQQINLLHEEKQKNNTKKNPTAAPTTNASITLVQIVHVYSTAAHRWNRKGCRNVLLFPRILLCLSFILQEGPGPWVTGVDEIPRHSLRAIAGCWLTLIWQAFHSWRAKKGEVGCSGLWHC